MFNSIFNLNNIIDKFIYIEEQEQKNQEEKQQEDDQKKITQPLNHHNKKTKRQQDQEEKEQYQEDKEREQNKELRQIKQQQQNQNLMLNIINYEKNNNKAFYERYYQNTINKLWNVRGLMFKQYTPINIISYNPTDDNKAIIYDSVKKTINLLNYNTEYKKVITNEDLE